MNEIIQSLNLPEVAASLEAWLQTHVLVPDTAVQTVIIILALAVSRLIGVRLRRFFDTARLQQLRWVGLRGFLQRFFDFSPPIVLLLFLLVAAEAGSRTSLFGHHLTQTAASLTGAWVIIRLASGFIRHRALANAIAWVAWALAALASLGLLGASLKLLDGIGMTFGQVRISLLTLLEGAFYLGILLWITMAVSNALERRVKQSKSLTPTTQELIAKIFKIVLVVLAFLITIGGLGIDLTTLAVFGGALGIGVGIGLQKVVSNLVSGLLILLDKSIKPDDVISVGATYGWVESLGARYASVRTRDGVEYLIPNEDLITQRVENWSHSDKAVRLNIPVGISYKSDVRLAMKLCKQAAKAVERVLAKPEPNCLLRGFGENSVDLEIRVWIDDPSEGRAAVINGALLGVWDLFQEHGIEFPFPQRDLHLKSSEVPLSVVDARNSESTGSEAKGG